MIIKKNKSVFIDYLFWFMFIIWTNPGGILTVFGEDSSKSGVDVKDYIFVLLFGCFVLVSSTFKIRDDVTFKKLIKYLLVFAFYYFVFFGFFVPILKENSNYTFLTFLIKSRRTVYSLLLFVMIYRFYLRSYSIFYKTLITSSIIILALFIFSFISGIEILPTERANRGFINIDRIFLLSYGLMELLIPMGVIIIVFKSNFKWKKLIIFAAMMMFISSILAVSRRHIIGPFIYLFIAIMLHNYFQRQELLPIKKIASVLFSIAIFMFFASLIFPKYVQASVDGIEESIYIIEHGESTTGRKDARLGIGKGFMQNLILNNPWFGTGYHTNWGGKAGDKMGYEPSDYPFLSAIAMMGVFGLLVFLPIYIILVRALIYDIGFLRKKTINYQSFDFFILAVCMLYFIYDLLQYINWFLPVSNSKQNKWYIFLALYFASRRLFYKKFNYKIQPKLKQ